MDDDQSDFEDDYVYSDEEMYSDDGHEEQASSLGAKDGDCKETDIDVAKASPSSTSSRSRAASMSGRNEIPNEGTYVIRSYDDITPFMDKLVNEVKSLLDCHADLARLLLQIVRWDKEKLIEEYFNDSEKFYEKNGVDLFDSSIIDRCKPELSLYFKKLQESKVDLDASESRLALADDDQMDDKTDIDEAEEKSTKKEDSKSDEAEDEKEGGSFQCRICYDEPAEREGVSLGCNHSFCYTCYNGYLVSQVGEGPACIYAHCPEIGCAQLVPRSIFQKVLGRDDPTLKSYDMHLKRNYIESLRTMRYCPSPGCSKVAVGAGVSKCECECGYLFCFKCGEEAHDPCNCSQLVEWIERCNNESETANWILANTKKCPRCGSRIEKNQGCNHMNCKMCRHEFCWTCMGSWAEHGQSTGGFYKCNRFEGKALGSDASEAEKAKADLDRYLHYYQRYHNHDHSLKFASAQRFQAERKMLKSQEANKSSWLDVQYNMQATEQVIECRRVLKYTYVLGFALEDESQEKQLFEHHQEMLEKNTERLQECTEEKEAVGEKLMGEHRAQVVNLTRVTEKFMTSLLETLKGGYVHAEEAADMDMDKAAEMAEGKRKRSGSGSARASNPGAKASMSDTKDA